MHKRSDTYLMTNGTMPQEEVDLLCNLAGSAYRATVTDFNPDGSRKTLAQRKREWAVLNDYVDDLINVVECDPQNRQGLINSIGAVADRASV